MGRLKSKQMKASITIEASLILPFITIIIVLMIYLSLFVYDRCIISQKLYIASLRGSLSEFNQNDIEQDMEEEIIKIATENVIGGNLSIKDSGIGQNKICNNTVFQLKNPFIKIAKSEGIHTSWNINTRKEIELINSVEYIRNIRRIEKIKEGV